MNKIAESFFFFSIQNPTLFLSRLKVFAPIVTSISQALDTSNILPPTFANIAFSASGLRKLGISESIGDPFFDNGQFADSAALGDPSTDNWIPAFKGTDLHGLILVSGATQLDVQSELRLYQGLFGSSITEIYTLEGQARPGDQQGHERAYFKKHYISLTCIELDC